MIRYAVVGAGWISQEAFMPAVAATGNSRMQAIVSGNPSAARALADFHGVPEVLTYADYDALLASDRIDAVYIALPNSMHADYTIRALRAGKHVLVEKPLATSLSDARAMVAAARLGGAFLMTAYRLHCEPATHAMLATLRNGAIGAPRFVSASFGFQLAAGNHRLKPGHWGGPLQDVGIYCVNAIRHIFEAEPVAVQAMTSRPAQDPRFAEVDESLAVTMLFPGDRLAQFFCSFGTAVSEMIRVVGTKGELLLDPAFRFESVFRMRVVADGQETVTNFPQVDHFAGQIAYFSDCIQSGIEPVPNGDEGLADMRALLAIEEAALTGSLVRLAPAEFTRRIDPEMSRSLELTAHRLVL